MKGQIKTTTWPEFPEFSGQNFRNPQWQTEAGPSRRNSPISGAGRSLLHEKPSICAVAPASRISPFLLSPNRVHPPSGGEPATTNIITRDHYETIFITHIH